MATYTTHEANRWDTRKSKELAREVANRLGYCGPAVVIWIAAVWNDRRGRPFSIDAAANQLSDGPRRFHGNWPGTNRRSLNVELGRLTNQELGIKTGYYFRKNTIFHKLEKYDFPIILCLKGPSFLDSLHYTTIYQAKRKEIRYWPDKVKFYWQDNGLYGKRNGGNPGLYGTGYSLIRGYFAFGAKRVYRKR